MRRKQCSSPVVFGCVLLSCVASPWVAGAKDNTVRLSPPDAAVVADAASGAGFTLVSSVRELSDGRLLVTDLMESRLSLVDWESGQVVEIARTGEGPGEYRGVGWVFPIGKDSSVVTDRMTRRWTIIRGTEAVQTLLPNEQLPFWLGPMFDGGDRRGQVLGTRPHPREGQISDPDTLALLLGHLGAAAVDTLALLRGPGAFGGNRQPLRTEEQALLFPDGWIAVALMEPYRVDWRSPDGSWIRGDSLPVPPIPVDDREKCFALERTHRPCEMARDFEWPEALPPFVLQDRPWMTASGTSPLFATPEGNLLVRRTPAGAAPGTHYDLIDRRGRRIGGLSLPANQAVVGFGLHAVFSVETNEFDLQTLRRHPWG